MQQRSFSPDAEYGGGSPTTAEYAAKPARGTPKISVSLNGQAGAEAVGILVAEKRGFFDDVGLLCLDRRSGETEDRRPLGYVADHTVEIGVSQQPQVVLAREKGMRVVAVGSLLPRPTAAMIWLRKSRIRSLADLRGKAIGVSGIPFQRLPLELLLSRAGVTPREVRIVNLRYDLVPALTSGRADAIFGGSRNMEGAALGAARPGAGRAPGPSPFRSGL